jgi:gluconolactonase
MVVVSLAREALHLILSDPRLHQLVEVEAGLSRVATGFRFAEGPVWDAHTKTLVFSDIVGDTLYRWSEGSGVSVVRRPSRMANGNTLDLQGRLITCEHATSRLVRTERDGTITVLASHYYSRELNSPNDVVLKSDGGLYFTDPTSGRSATYGIPRVPELPFCGVYRFDPSSGTLSLLTDDFSKPNGLAFAPDESRLFVSDSDRDHIRVFDIAADGTLHGGRVWGHLPTHGVGVADGMKVDRAGNLYCCGRGGIHIFNPDGERLGMIAMPEHTANLAWGDDDLLTLYTTASTSLYCLRMKRPGFVTDTRRTREEGEGL